MTSPQMPPDVEKVSDLTDQHIGWEVHVSDPQMATSVRSVWVLGIARREFEGASLIEVRDGLNRPGAATLFRYAPDTPCRVSRQFPQPRKSRRRSR